MKIFPLFSVYLLEIDTVQLKNSNYKCPFIRLVNFHEIWSEGISISIQYLPVQIKVHKENIRTKCENSEMYSEPCEISKMRLWKIVNNFQPLTILAKSFIVDDCLGFEYAPEQKISGNLTVFLRAVIQNFRNK